jgi:hypothetical protein
MSVGTGVSRLKEAEARYRRPPTMRRKSTCRAIGIPKTIAGTALIYAALVALAHAERGFHPLEQTTPFGNLANVGCAINTNR